MKRTTLFSKKSFTLLEIIIVVIIVGVLASLALTPLRKTLKNVEAVEALRNFRLISDSIHRCTLLQAQGSCGCVPGLDGVTWDALDMDDPFDSPGSKFTYGGQVCHNAHKNRFGFYATSKSNPLDSLIYLYSGQGGMCVDKCCANVNANPIAICGKGAFSSIHF